MKCPTCNKQMMDDIEYASGECFDCQTESAKREDEYPLKLEIEKLQAENRKLRECVEFYANKENWNSVAVNSNPDCMNYYYYINEEFGGEKAREILKGLEG